MKPKIIALVPMKGNSERVPNKNLKKFNGSPLYHVIINTLLKSSLIDSIIINTDSDKIADDIKFNFKNKIEIRIRDERIRGDFVSMNKIIEDDLLNSNADIYIQTHSTNPLLDVNSIDKALTLMINNIKNNFIYFDSIFSVTKIQTRFYDINAKPINHDPNKLIRTQDLDPMYEENSCFFIFTKSSFKNSNNKRIGINPKLFEIDKVESVDIDTIDDFIIAEALYKSKLLFMKSMNNNLKSKLKSKELSIGSWLTIPSTEIIEILSTANFEWLVIDMEHTTITFNELKYLVKVIQGNKMKALVRISKNDETEIKKVLDLGCDGIIIPMIKNKSEMQKGY